MKKTGQWVVWCALLLGLVSTFFALPLAAERASARGVWLASIDFGGGLTRRLVLELEERVDGRLIGYLLGGTSQRTMVSGRRISKDVNLELELKIPGASRAITVWGRISGGRITGSASDGGPARSIVLDPIPGIVHERRFLLGVAGASGEPELLGEMAVALDEREHLLGGAWVSASSCVPWGCDGEITDLHEVSDSSGLTTLTFTFENTDICSRGSAATLAFDASTMIYSGSYTLNTCPASVGGELFAVRTTRTRSDHVSQVLQGLGRLADDHESTRPFSSLHPSFSSAYLEYGHQLDDLLFLYNAENAPYKKIEATFNRVSLITTVPEPYGNPFEAPPPYGAVFEERRRGTPVAGTTPVIYVDSATQERRPWLRVWRQEAGRWVIYGSQTEGLDLPFRYSIGPKSLEVPFGASTEAGTIHVYLAPFGAHFPPHTGHAFGNAKIDFLGLYTASDADLTTFPDGQKGYYGGLPSREDSRRGYLLLDRRPVYISPADGSIQSVECSTGRPLDHLGEPDWIVSMGFSTGEGFRIGFGKVAPDLAGKLSERGISVGGTCPGSGNLISESIPIMRGETLGYPHVIAHELPLHPGYFAGGDWFPDRPWVYMEFFIAADFGGETANACYYAFRPLRQQQYLQAALTADMLDSHSQHFWSPVWPRYQWQAESRLCMAPSILPTDFSNLYTRLGGWFEKDAAGITSNEMVGFAPIAREEGTAYDPRLYESPAVDMLVARKRPHGFSCGVWPVPAGTSTGTTNCDSAGEVLERTPDSLLIKWRGVANPYQRAAYFLDPDRGLKISWGGYAARAADATQPALTPGTSCDGATVVCYDHTERPGY